jgi:hypothetical protein
MPIVRVPGTDSSGEVLPIYVEVDTLVTDPTSIYGDELTREGAAEKVMTAARDWFSDGVELARSCAARVADGLVHLPEGVRRPDEFELQIAIKLDSQFGAVLAKASAGAQMQVSMRWRLGEDE